MNRWGSQTHPWAKPYIFKPKLSDAITVSDSEFNSCSYLSTRQPRVNGTLFPVISTGLSSIRFGFLLKENNIM